MTSAATLALGAVVVLTIVIAAVLGARRAHPPGRTESAAAAAPVAPAGCARAGGARDALREKMRRLWSDHVDRTNLFIIASLAGAPDAAVAASHLHSNQDEIAAAFGGYYGPRAASALARLLHEHVDGAAEVVKAYRDNTPADALVAAWYKNADEVAAFLSNANTHWSFPAASAMMRAHLDVTAEYLSARVSENWGYAAGLHDVVIDQAMHTADMLVDGIRAAGIPDPLRWGPMGPPKGAG